MALDWSVEVQDIQDIQWPLTGIGWWVTLRHQKSSAIIFQGGSVGSRHDRGQKLSTAGCRSDSIFLFLLHDFQWFDWRIMIIISIVIICHFLLLFVIVCYYLLLFVTICYYLLFLLLLLLWRWLVTSWLLIHTPRSPVRPDVEFGAVATSIAICPDTPGTCETFTGWWWLEHGWIIMTFNYDFPETLGNVILSQLTNSLHHFFQRGWNHQPDL